MTFFWKKSKHDEEALAKLESALKNVSALSAPSLTAEQKERMRAHLFQKITERTAELRQFAERSISEQPAYQPAKLERLASWIFSVAQSVRLAPAARASLQERVFVRIESTRPSRMRFWSAWQKGLSFAVLTLFVTATLAFIGEVPATFAHSQTTLEILRGDVFLTRNNETQIVQKEQVLNEGDIVKIDSSGEAVIHYFDHSFSRLFANTEIQLRRLHEDEDGFSMVVEVDLNSGKIWSRVFDLVSHSEFTVRAKELITSVYRRATFVVSAEQEKASVQVIHNVVGVKTSESFQSQTLVKGYQAVVNKQTSIPAVKPLQLAANEQKWVDNILEKDEKLIASVQEEEKRQREETDSAPLLLSFDDVEKSRLAVTVAGQKLSEATPEVRQQAFDHLVNVLEQTREKSNQMNDEQKTKQLNAIVDETLSRFSREVVSEEIDSTLKNQVFDAQVRLASNEKDQLSALVDQASSLLIESQEGFDKGDSEVGRKALNFYMMKMIEIRKLQEKVQDIELQEKINRSERFYAFLVNGGVGVGVVRGSDSVGTLGGASEQNSLATAPVDGEAGVEVDGQVATDGAGVVSESEIAESPALVSPVREEEVKSAPTIRPVVPATPDEKPPEVMLPKLELGR